MQGKELYKQLCDAAEEGNIEKIKELLAQGADVNADPFGHGESAFMVAARKGETAVMQCLLENGANINHRDENGFTPLFNAIYSRSIAAVRLLLERGADANATTAQGMTALDYATGFKFPEAVECLREHGATPDSEQTQRIRKALREIEAAMNTPDSKQTQSAHKTADKAKLDAMLAQHTLDMQLWDAAEKGNVEEIKTLLAQGASANAVNGLTPFGESALMVAATKGHIAAMQCLLEHGANASYKDEEWHTPLMCAIHSGDIAAVRLLLEHGAEVNTATANGTTALELAGIFKFTEAVECLLKHGAVSKDVERLLARMQEHGAAPDSRQTPQKQSAAGNDSAAPALLKKRSAGIITSAVAPFQPLVKTFLFFIAGIITNTVLPLLPRLALRYGLIDSDYAYTPVVSMATVLIIKALLASEALCGVAAIAVAIHARASEKPLPALFDFFIGFFLAGVVFLIRYRGLFF